MKAHATPLISIQQFESGQVDAEQFDHEAHVYVGWLFVRTFELGEAIARYDTALKRLTKKLGMPEKYHATITWLFLMLINERAREDDWPSFVARNHDLVADSKSTLQKYYSEELLFSDRARKHFVLPDKLAA